MMPNINTTSAGIPTAFGAEAQEIARRRRMAEALQAQSMQPLETNQTAGGFVVPVSPLQGLAKMLQAYAGMKGMDRAQADEKALAGKVATGRQELLAKALRMAQGTPDVQPLTPNDDEGNVNPAIPGQKPDLVGASAEIAASGDPIAMTYGNAFLKKALEGNEALVAKINPKDFTQASIQKYMTSRNPADLVPVREMKLGNFGGASGFYDPYNVQPGTIVPHTLSPDTQARLDQSERHWANLSPYQQAQLGNEQTSLGLRRESLNLDRARLGNENTRLYWDTGMGGGGVPRPTLAPSDMPQQPPQGAPAGPAMPPQAAAPAAPGLPPRVQAEVAKEQALATQQNARALPGAIAKAEQQIALIDQMIGDAGRQLPPGQKPRAPHPGFQSSVGMGVRMIGAGMIPGSDTSNFKALMDQVRGGQFMQAYETLKGGGQITEIEGKKATDAISRMSLAQSESEFVKAAREFQDVIRAGAERAKRAAQVNYSAPQPQGQPSVDDLLKRYGGGNG